MDEHLETLQNLFPDLPEVKLRNALSSSENNVNLACSILLSELDSTVKSKHSPQIQELVDMFPELPKETIKDTFSLRKENLEDTIHDLLCLNTLSAEERDLQVLEYKPYVGGSEAKKAPKNQNDSGSVSYTHLDVYKRQPFKVSTV